MSFSNIHNSCSLSVNAFHIIRDQVNRRFGILFGEGDRYLIESRLCSRVTELNLSGFEQYIELLNRADNGQELDNAIELLTNNETYFFREEYQLASFAKDLLPEIRKRNESKRQLTIWSAGCSSGEELYTIAIYLAESGLFANWDLRLFGSDINTRMLSRARTGNFGKSAFRNTPKYLRMKYFQKQGSEWQVEKSIRDKCSFGKINLLDGNRAYTLGRFDAIFCRNVLMYFDRSSRRNAIDLFHGRLNPHGYLLLGHTESLLNLQTPFVQLDLNDTMVYQKQEASFA